MSFSVWFHRALNIGSLLFRSHTIVDTAVLAAILQSSVNQMVLCPPWTGAEFTPSEGQVELLLIRGSSELPGALPEFPSDDHAALQ